MVFFAEKEDHRLRQKLDSLLFKRENPEAHKKVFQVDSPSLSFQK